MINDDFDSIERIFAERDRKLVEKSVQEAYEKSVSQKRYERSSNKKAIDPKELTRKIIALILAGVTIVGGTKVVVHVVDEIKDTIEDFNEQKRFDKISKKLGSLVNSEENYLERTILSQCTKRTSDNQAYWYDLEEIAKKILSLDPELQEYALCGVIDDFYYRHKFLPNLGMLVYGKIDMMIIKSCLIGTYYKNKTIKCQRCHKYSYSLKDRMGVSFALKGDENCNTRLLNAYPLYLIDRISELKDMGIKSFYLMFNDENNIDDIVNNLYDNMNEEVSIMSKKFTRGHYYNRSE